ncbi:hypothetical protein GC169_13800 [bacterium]|nr:hypothetical protein [bacterium]
MDVAIFVPLIVFGSLVLIVWIAFHFGQRKRTEAHQTLRLALEKGQAVSSEMMEEIARMGAHPLADLRRSIIFFALALAFGILAVIVGVEEAEAVRPLLGVAVFPFCVAVAYLALHFVSSRNRR